MNIHTDLWIDDATVQDDSDYLEMRWQRIPVGSRDIPIIDQGNGYPLVFVPILEHLEFVYARQIRALSKSRRIILYRRHETRTVPVVVAERVEELRQVLDVLELDQADLLAHGDAAMVLLEFATRYPQRCRSLIIIAQAADYQIAPHPFIWFLHELFVRVPIEHILPAWFLRRLVINYIMAASPHNTTTPRLTRQVIEEQFRKISLWPFVYKFSVLPVIHSFDIRNRLAALTMPVFLINRADDALSPEWKTAWLARNLPDCQGYHVVSGGERFFMYSQAETVTPLIEAFLVARETLANSPEHTIS